MILTPILPRYVYFIGAILLALCIGLLSHLSDHTQGIHFIRQSDSVSFIYHYLIYGLDLFSPGTLSYNSLDAKAACEFPILYYAGAMLHTVGLEPTMSLRLFSVVANILGIYALLRLAHSIIANKVLALFSVVLCCSSGVYLYYAQSTLPDGVAIGAMLYGLYHGLFFITGAHRSKSSVFKMTIALTLSLSLKITYGIYPIALLLTYLALVSPVFGKEKLTRMGLGFMGALLTSLALPFLWFSYAVQYNEIWQDTYFLTSSVPYWKLSDEEIRIVWDHLTGWWYASYFHSMVIWAIPVGMAVLLVRIKQLQLGFTLFIWAACAGSLCFLILFFGKLRDHDYYMMTLAPTVFLILIFAISQLILALSDKRLLRYALTVIMIALSLVSMKHGQSIVSKRYGDANDYYAYVIFSLKGAADQLNELGIPQEAKFAVIPDRSPNGGLIALERAGWNIVDTSTVEMVRLQTLVSNAQLDYIAVVDSTLMQNEALRSALGTEVLRGDHYFIYSTADAEAN